MSGIDSLVDQSSLTKASTMTLACVVGLLEDTPTRPLVASMCVKRRFVILRLFAPTDAY
jgi:hypothetical protein